MQNANDKQGKCVQKRQYNSDDDDDERVETRKQDVHRQEVTARVCGGVFSWSFDGDAFVGGGRSPREYRAKTEILLGGRT